MVKLWGSSQTLIKYHYYDLQLSIDIKKVNLIIHHQHLRAQKNKSQNKRIFTVKILNFKFLVADTAFILKNNEMMYDFASERKKYNLL